MNATPCDVPGNIVNIIDVIDEIDNVVNMDDVDNVDDVDIVDNVDKMDDVKDVDKVDDVDIVDDVGDMDDMDNVDDIDKKYNNDDVDIVIDDIENMDEVMCTNWVSGRLVCQADLTNWETSLPNWSLLSETLISQKDLLCLSILFERLVSQTEFPNKGD